MAAFFYVLQSAGWQYGQMLPHDGPLYLQVLILIVDPTPWGNLIFGIAPIAGEVWLFIIPFALGMVVLEELVSGW